MEDPTLNQSKGFWRELVKEVSMKVKKSKTIRRLKAILHENKDNSSKLEETLLVNHQEDQISQSLNPQNSTWLKINVKIPKKDKAIVIETNDCVLVNDIKSKIFASERIKPNKFALCYNGAKTEDNRPLVSHGIKTESTLYLIFHPRRCLPIIVKTPCGKTPMFKVDVLSTVGGVKAIVESFIGYSVRDCKMIYSGNELDDLKTLASHGIQNKHSTFELRPPSICVTSNKKFIALETKICHGKKFEDYRTLVTLETKRKSSFHLDSHPIIPLLPIRVRLPDGKTQNFSISILNTVLDVKTIVESLTGIPISKIVFAETELEDRRSLAFYGLEESPGLKISINFYESLIIDP